MLVGTQTVEYFGRRKWRTIESEKETVVEDGQHCTTPSAAAAAVSVVASMKQSKGENKSTGQHEDMSQAVSKHAHSKCH